MNLKLAFSVALTHLLSKWRPSLVAMLGVMFGISMFIVMISFMTGVNQFTEDMAMDNTPHIRISNPVQVNNDKIVADAAANRTDDDWFVVRHRRPRNDLPRIRNAMLIADGLEKLPEVVGVAPQVSTQVFFNNGPVQIPGNVSGINVQREIALFGLDNKMEEGELQDLQRGSNVIVIGRGLANKLSVNVGDRVSITTPDGNNLILRVVGIFSFGISTIDDTRSYATISTVQKILQRDPSYITDLSVQLKDMRLAVPLREKLQQELPGVLVEDWQSANAALLAGDNIRNVMTFVVSFTLLLVAGFGIYNIMNMNIINKMKEIAIMKATGFEGHDITAIFLLESLIIGVAGGLMGLLVGFTFSYLLSITPFTAGSFFRMDTFPVAFVPAHYLMGLSFGFLTTLFAGFFPSRKAARVDPVRIIRG
jgi:lipoprotein-releasing system permease protein